jgi:hypothetical protein
MVLRLYSSIKKRAQERQKLSDLYYKLTNYLPMAMFAKFSTITGLACLIAGSLCLLGRAFLAF